MTKTRMKFRITGVLLTLAMLLATLSSFAIPAFAAEEDGSTDVIDASAMTADELQAAVTERLNAGHTAITVNLAEDADATMFSAITAALATTVDPSLDQYELVMNYSGTIDLTISGAKTVPECTFYVDEYVNENWRAGAALRSVTLTDATTIGESAFFSSAMTSFFAPNVIEIEGFALEGCMKLTDVYLPSVQTLGDAVFSDCYALKTISLPECIDLGNGVFNSCEALETVYAPKATNLGAIEFMMCTSLMKVTLGSVVSVNQIYESIDNGLFCLANDTKNIELILACDQKALSFDSSTKYWTATEEAFDFGNTNDFMGYTFKSITMAHTPEADDGDCITALICSACGETVVEAKESHTTELDENKATCQHGDICDLCGSEYGATDPHSFVDGKCACGIKQFDIYGQQLNIGGDLSIKYYVTAFGDGVSTDTLKMKFIFLGRETVVSGIYNAEMGMYVFTLEGINPQCMGDKIDAYLLLNGEEKASKLFYTVEENLLALRKEYEEDEALVTLVNDILAYGTAASEYKNHNSMTDVYVGSDREIRETEWPALDIGFEGYTVVFGQVNYLKIKVNLAEGQTLYLDGVNVTAKVVDGIFKTDGIAPTNFDKKFNFEIRTDGVLFNAFSVSVDDYLSAKRESETMGKLVKALYNYGVSAEAYDHVKNGVGEHLDRVYAPNSSSTHQATCICGDVITDNHEFDTTNGKCICGAIQLTVVNAPDYDDDPFGDGWIDEKELRYTGSITETQDAGKYDWNDEDQIIVTLISETIGTQTCVLTYDDSIWTLNGSFVYAEGETPTVTAVYAPAGTSGLGDYIPANCTFAGSSITIDFNDVTRNYSRLRIVGAPNQTLTVTTTDFTPAGATIELGPEPFALTTDELGNAYLYGSFAEGANIIVKKGEVVLVEYAFNEEWTLGGTKPNTSYVLDARPIIDGTLGGKTTAEESDITALVEQLKAYVDNGITTIIVTGEDPAMYNLLGSDLPAVSAAIFFLGSSGSETNGDHDSPYCGTIDLIMPDATSLAYMEFCSTYALNSVTLPNVTKIADQAFHDTPYLRTITFGSVLTEVNETGGVMFAQVGKEVGGCELILNCGQMNESSVPTPDLTTNTWKFKFENEFKSITLTHTGECDECKALH